MNLLATGAECVSPAKSQQTNRIAMVLKIPVERWEIELRLFPVLVILQERKVSSHLDSILDS